MFDRHTAQPSAAAERGYDPTLILATLKSSADEMTLSEVRTLLSLAMDGPQTVSSVAERVHLDESTIDASCSVLVTCGFVVEIPTASAAGASVMALSVGGRRRVDDAMAQQRPIFDRAPSRLTSEPA